jgi:hypothetical protein
VAIKIDGVSETDLSSYFISSNHLCRDISYSLEQPKGDGFNIKEALGSDFYKKILIKDSILKMSLDDDESIIFYVKGASLEGEAAYLKIIAKV